MFVGLAYINGVVFHPVPVAHNSLHGLCKDFFFLLFGGEPLKSRYEGDVEEH